MSADSASRSSAVSGVIGHEQADKESITGKKNLRLNIASQLTIFGIFATHHGLIISGRFGSVAVIVTQANRQAAMQGKPAAQLGARWTAGDGH